jgi:hypothetical protein
MKTFQTLFIWTTLLLVAALAIVTKNPWLVIGCVIAVALVNAGFHRTAYSGLCRVTLSVPELSQLVIDAFKVQTPELFGSGGFALDIESKTAKLGDVITSHIVSVPTAQNYDPATGFANGVQESTDLLVDVPVTLNQFKHVPIRIKYLTQLSSKINLMAALKEQAFALRKLVIDTALGTILPANFTYQEAEDPANISLDTCERIRGKLNTQRAGAFGRFGIVSTAFAAALQADQRVGSSLFYQQLNGDSAYRRYKNLAGFENIYEYPDFPATANLQGYFGDRRGIIVAVRPIDIAQVTPADLGIPEVMSFTPMQDPESGLPFVAVGWQQAGTGDLYVSIGMLFGVSAGNQGGAQNAITDRSGVRCVSAGNDV